MDDNRIRLKMKPELTPVRLEDRMDVKASIDVQVNSNLRGLSVAGLVLMALGLLAMVVGLVMLVIGYPEDWQAWGEYEGHADAMDWDESRGLIETVVLSVGAGFTLLLLGSAMFFYGRTVVGKGRLDRFTMGGST